MGQCGFGSLTPKQIMDNTMTLYGKTSLPELETSLQLLIKPMDRSKPIEVMLHNIEGVQIFLLSNPEGKRQLSNISLISYALIKMNNTGLYGKPIER